MKNYFNLKKSKLLLLTLLTMLVVGARPAWAQNMEPTVACPAPTNLAVTAESITAREATVTWEGTSDSYVVMIGEDAVSADFETGDLSQAGFTSSSDYPWTVVANTHSGAYCAKSGNGGYDSSTSYLSLEVNLTADMTLTFSAKVSSESYDGAYFEIDGVKKFGISGDGNWIDYSYPLTAGTHILKWRYTKDGNGNSNGDCFYVDDIVVSAGVDSWTEYNTNAQTYTFTNLTPNRHYQVKVKGNCGDEGYSQETDPVGFTTLALDAVPFDLQTADVTATTATLNWNGAQDSYNVRYRKLVFFDDFENGLGNWTTYTNGDAAAWETGNPISGLSGHNSSTNVAFSMSWNNNVSYHADNWLVTPQVQLGGTLKFYVYTNQYYPDAYEVKLSTGGNTPDDFTVTLQEMASIPTTGDWVEVNIDLSSYEGQSGYIAIHHFFYDGNYILVDDFGISQEAGEWIEATSSTNSFDITGLTPGTIYEFQVQGLYGEDGKSNWSASATFTTNSEIELVNDDSENEAGKKNADYIAAAENKSCDVTLSGRTFYKDGQWNTLCLPFSVTLAGSPLEGATARTLTAADVTGSGDDTHISLTFGDPVEQLAAGVPYIIKWANDGSDNIENPEFTGVTIGSTEGQTLSFLEGQVQFKGNYSAFTVGDNANIYYMAASEDATHEGILRKAASTRTMLACRAYFQFSGADAARSVILNFGEGETTGIVEQRSENTTADGSWYTVDGVKLNKQPARKGLYIQGGRKVVVK